MTVSQRPAPNADTAANRTWTSSPEDESLRGELEALRAVVAGLAPRAMGSERLPSARAELAAVRREVEGGVNRILDAAEAILQAGGEQHDAVQGHALAILESCGFNDLIGQRLSKVEELLVTLEQRLTQVSLQAGVVDGAEVETATERLRREQVIRGPAMNGPDVAQSEIDALFG